MALLSLLIDLRKQLNILVHNLLVLFFVDILIFLKHKSQIVNIILKISSFIGILSMHVAVTGFVLIFNLFFHIFFMKSDDPSFEFLEISDVMKTLIYIIFEFFLICFL